MSDFLSEKYSDELMIVAFAGMGVEFENITTNSENIVLYISVPEVSYKIDIYGKQMAGANLALRFKKTLEAMGLKHFIVKSRTRKGENWTEEDKKESVDLYKEKLLKDLIF